MGMSVPSLHRDSTSYLISVHVVVQRLAAIQYHWFPHAGLMAGNDKTSSRAFTEIVKATDEWKAFIDLLKHITDTISSAVNDIIAKLNALHYEKFELGEQNIMLQRSLKRASEMAFKFASNVGELYEYGGDKARQTGIRAELCKENCNPTALNNYISELQRHLSKCGESYQKVQEAVNGLIKDSGKAAQLCERMALEASWRRKITNVISGLAVVGSFYAAVRIFPFGTIGGLSVIAATTVIAGGGTSVVIQYIAPDFEEVENEFKHLNSSFTNIQLCASKIDDFINVLKTQLDSKASTVDNANAIMNSEYIEAFDSICKAFGQSHEASAFRKKLMEIDSELKARFNEVHVRK